MPVLNAAAYLPTQLEALAAQTYGGDWELVIADNGSSDATKQIVEGWMDRLPLTLVDAPGHRAAAAARNVAAARAAGDVFALCDGDDRVAPDWIEVVAAEAAENDFLAGAIDYFSLNPFAPPWKDTLRNQPLYWMGRGAYADSANMAVRRDAYFAVGGFDDHLEALSDADISFRLRLAGYQMRFVPEMLVAKRLRPGLKGAWRQSVAWGVGDVRLYQTYRHTTALESQMRGPWRAHSAGAHLSRLGAALRPKHARAWIEFTARHWGRVKGSVRERVILL